MWQTAVDHVGPLWQLQLIAYAYQIGWKYDKRQKCYLYNGKKIFLCTLCTLYEDLSTRHKENLVEYICQTALKLTR